MSVADERRESRAGTGRIEGLAPIVPVRSVEVSKTFYCDLLGFGVVTENAEGTSALIERDGARLMLLRITDRDALQATGRHFSAYLWVEGIDRLWDEIAPRAADLPDWRMRAPFDQPYGMREFHLRDPDGFLLFFAEPAGSTGL